MSIMNTNDRPWIYKLYNILRNPKSPSMNWSSRHILLY